MARSPDLASAVARLAVVVQAVFSSRQKQTNATVLVRVFELIVLSHCALFCACWPFVTRVILWRSTCGRVSHVLVDPDEFVRP
jgi:hypothetical protein